MTDRPYQFNLSRTFSTNHMHANRKRTWDPISRKWRGGRTLSEAYKAWREMAGREMIAQGPRPQFKCAVHVSVEIGTMFYAGDRPTAIPEKFDADNQLKPICDLLHRQGVVPDDRWRYIPECTIRVSPDVIGAIVTVYPLPYRFDGKADNIRKVNP